MLAVGLWRPAQRQARWPRRSRGPGLRSTARCNSHPPLPSFLPSSPFLSLPLPSSPLLSPPLPSSPFLSPPLSSPLYATLSSYMFLSPLPFSSLQDWNNPSSLHGSPLKAWFLHGQLRKRPVDHFWKRGFFETLWSVGPREKAGRLGACNAKQHI